LIGVAEKLIDPSQDRVIATSEGKVTPHGNGPLDLEIGQPSMTTVLIAVFPRALGPTDFNKMVHGTTPAKFSK
jgi:hypothetical protein